MVLSLLVSRRTSTRGNQLKLWLFDIKRTYFNALASREHLYIEVPNELVPDVTNPRGVTRVLRRSMYGTRDAVANW